MFFLVGIDQASKHLIRNSNMEWLCNPGIAFGMRIPLGLFYLAWIIIIVGLLLWSRKNPRIPKLAVALALSGGISNIIDRLVFGCVTDFIDLRIWPVFNLADIMIVCGSALIAAKLLEDHPDRKQNPD